MSALRIEQLATELIGPISFDIAAGECLARCACSCRIRMVADCVCDHFPANYDATGQIEKLELASSLEWEVGRLSTARF